MLQVVALLGLALLLTGCESSDASGPGPDPIISNLRLSQTTTPTQGRIRLDFDAFDLSGDIVGGLCAIEMGAFGSVQVSITVPGDNASFAVVNCSFTYSGHGVSVTGTVRLIDRAGHASNRLGFSFVSEGRASPAAGPIVIEKALR
jgi:hypothetical protein